MPAPPATPPPAAPSHTDAFAAIPAAAAPAVAKPQLVADAFGSVPAGPLPPPSARKPVSAAGFGAAGATIAAPSHVAAAGTPGGFGAISTTAPPPVSGPQPPSRAAFGAAVASDPVKPPAAPRKPVVEALEILYKPRPAYTGEARSARIEGDVVLEVLFSASGTLRVLRTVQGLGYGLEKQALEAASRIRFRPAREDGRAVDTVATVRISFQMAY